MSNSHLDSTEIISNIEVEEDSLSESISYNKITTSRNPEYIQNIIENRKEVLEALYTENETKVKLAQLNKIYPLQQAHTKNVLNQFMEQAMLHYTHEYIEEMINNAENPHTKLILQNLYENIIEQGYSYDKIELLINYDIAIPTLNSNTTNEETQSESNLINSTSKEKTTVFSYFYKKILRR